MNGVATLSRDSLVHVLIEGERQTRLSAFQDADRTQAIADLEAENSFLPSNLPDGAAGPYVLHLSLQEGRLGFDIRDEAGAPLVAFILALGPFRRLIKDYQLLVESHESACGRRA